MNCIKSFSGEWTLSAGQEKNNLCQIFLSKISIYKAIILFNKKGKRKTKKDKNPGLRGKSWPKKEFFKDKNPAETQKYPKEKLQNNAQKSKKKNCFLCISPHP